MGVLLVVLSIAHEYTDSTAHFKVLKTKYKKLRTLLSGKTIDDYPQRFPLADLIQLKPD